MPGGEGGYSYSYSTPLLLVVVLDKNKYYYYSYYIYCDSEIVSHSILLKLLLLLLLVVVVVTFNPSIDNSEIANNIRPFPKYIIFHEDILKVSIYIHSLIAASSLSMRDSRDFLANPILQF